MNGGPAFRTDPVNSNIQMENSSRHCVIARIREWVERTPNVPALIDGDAVYSYAEIWRASCGVADLLSPPPEASGLVVCVAAVRKPETYASILGALIAGTAYLPVDPELPRPVIQSVLDKVAPFAILAAAGDARRFSGCGLPVREINAAVLTESGGNWASG